MRRRKERSLSGEETNFQLFIDRKIVFTVLRTETKEIVMDYGIDIWPSTDTPLIYKGLISLLKAVSKIKGKSEDNTEAR